MLIGIWLPSDEDNRRLRPRTSGLEHFYPVQNWIRREKCLHFHNDSAQERKTGDYAYNLLDREATGNRPSTLTAGWIISHDEELNRKVEQLCILMLILLRNRRQRTMPAACSMMTWGAGWHRLWIYNYRLGSLYRWKNWLKKWTTSAFKCYLFPGLEERRKSTEFVQGGGAMAQNVDRTLYIRLDWFPHQWKDLEVDNLLISTEIRRQE